MLILKSVNRDNDDFSYNSRNIKNTVDNVNKNLTPSSAQKSNINTDKSVNDSNIQSNNNYASPDASPTDVFNRDNTNELAQSSICINENFITPLPVLYDRSKINTPQNIKSETVTSEKATTGNKSNEEKVATSKDHWRNDATLIMGDSKVSGVMEKNMTRNQKVKIRFFSGAKITDMFHYAIPSFEKKHDCVILNFCADDAPYKPGLDILNGMLKVMNFINVVITKISIKKMEVLLVT